MGVNLGGGDVGMAQHHLHGAEVRAMFQQVGGKGVAEHVGADFLGDSVQACNLLDDLPETQTGHGFAMAGDKEEIAPLFFQNPGTRLLGVDLEVFAGRFAKGDEPFLGAFAENPDIAAHEIDPGQGQIDQLRDPHARGVKQVEHGIVTQGQGIVIGRRGKEPVHFGDSEHLGERAARLGQIKDGAGIGVDGFFRQEKLEESAQRGDSAGIASVGDALAMTMVEIGAEVLGFNLGQAGEAFWSEKIKKGGEISLVGQDGVARQAAFQGEILKELVEERLGKKKTLRRGKKTAVEAGPGRSVGSYQQVFLFCCSFVQ